MLSQLSSRHPVEWLSRICEDNVSIQYSILKSLLPIFKGEKLNYAANLREYTTYIGSDRPGLGEMSSACNVMVNVHVNQLQRFGITSIRQ